MMMRKQVAEANATITNRQRCVHRPCVVCKTVRSSVLGHGGWSVVTQEQLIACSADDVTFRYHYVRMNGRISDPA